MRLKKKKVMITQLSPHFCVPHQIIKRAIKPARKRLKRKRRDRFEVVDLKAHTKYV